MSRVLGLDPGTRRVGVAISDSRRTLAMARACVPVDDLTIATLSTLIAEEGVTLVVVGRPISMGGTETASTQLSDGFASDLASSVDPVEVVRWDERLTTVSARRQLHQSGVKDREQRALIDSAAAVVMLQHFIDASHA